jgi:hypothetical protein
MFKQLGSVSTEPWRVLPTFVTVYATFVEYTWSQVVIGIVLYVMVLLGWTLIRPFVLKTGVVRDNIASSPGALAIVFAWLVFPHILPFAASYIVAPIYLARYTSAAVPAFYLLFALSVQRLFGGVVRAVVVMVVLALQGYGLFTYYTGITHDQWREVVKYVEETACPGDLVIFFASYGRTAYDYYSRRTDLTYQQISAPDRDGVVQNLQELPATLLNTNRAWLIEYQVENAEPVTHILDGSGFRLTSASPYFHITVDLFEKESRTACP